MATCPIVKALVLMRCKHVIQGESAWLQAIAAAAAAAATAAYRFAVITATVTFTVMAEVAAVTAAVTAAPAATAGAAAMIAQPLLCHHLAQTSLSCTLAEPSIQLSLYAWRL